MDEDQRQVGGFEPGDDDTSPEVTAVRSTSVGTDPGPAPEDEVVVLDDVDEDATGALDVTVTDDDDAEDLQLDLDDLEEEPVRPVVRLPSYEQGGDDLDTSPEVTAVRSTSVGTDPGPAPEDEVVVLDDVDEDATGALDVTVTDDDDAEDLQLDLDDLEEEPVRPVVRLPSYEQGGDDLD